MKMINRIIDKWELDADKSNVLVIGGCSTVQLSNIYETPLHVVNEERLKQTAISFLTTVKAKLSRKKHLSHFAFKCNPVPGIIKSNQRSWTQLLK